MNTFYSYLIIHRDYSNKLKTDGKKQINGKSLLILFLLISIFSCFKQTSANPNTVIFDGIADNYTCNKNAINAAIGTTDTLFIPKGNDYYKIIGSVTIPSGKTIIFDDGAKFNVTGNLIGNQTKLIAGDYEIFNKQSVLSGSWIADTLKSSWTGAIGDGVADDFYSLNLFLHLNNITTYDEARLGLNKNYYITKQLLITVINEININGNGSNIFRRYADLAANECILSFTGSSAFTKSLTTNLVGGQMSMVVDDATGLQVGMGIELLSNELYGKEDMGDGKWHYHYKGLLSEIISINGNTIVMADTVPYNFIASEVTSLKFYSVYPLSLKNINFSSENITGTRQMTQLRLSKLFDVNISDVVFSPLGYSGLTTSSIYNGGFHKITLLAPTSGGDDYTFGVYGIIPSFNVNCIFDSIYGRARTHGIAFTNSPSYNVVVKNSNFKANNNVSNGADSHASHWIKFENCTIYGFQGNWGTFIFDNCDMYACGGNTVFNEREGSSRGGPSVFFTNCNFYTSASSSGKTLFYRYANDDTSTFTGQYTIINNVFYLDNNLTYLTTAASPGPATNIRPFRVENNVFYGTGTLYLPKHFSTTPATNGGVFAFKSNSYSKIKWNSPPLDQFQTIDIIGNVPVNENTSDFWVNWDALAGNVNFKDNVFVGTNFWILNCTGNILFDNNQIHNNILKSTSSYKNRNYLCNNINLNFTNNNLWNNQWTLTGNQLVENNSYNGFTQPQEPAGNWLDINTPDAAVETGVSMEGLSNYTIISRAKMVDNTTNAVQYLVGSSVSKLYLGFNPVVTSPQYKGVIRNINGTSAYPALSRFYMDNEWHTYVFVMENKILKGYMDGIAMLSYDASAVYNQMYTAGTIQIGGTNTTNLWKGSVQSFIIYDKALSLLDANAVSENPELTISGEIYKLINPENLAPSGYWAFNEANGGIAIDSSENTLSGSLINGPLWQSGVFGNALQFDGINDRVDCGSDPALDMGKGDFSISIWVKMGSSQVSYPTLISKGGSNNTNAGLWLYISSNGLKLNFSDGTSRIAASSASINIMDDTWHHAAISIDRDGNAIFYVDGVNQGSSDVSSFSGKDISNLTRTLTIGSLGTSASTLLKGKLDEVRIYHRVINEEEILVLSTPIEEVENIISYWAFNELSGNYATDSSGNEITGTLINNPAWQTGVEGNALQFDGINDRVDFGTSSNLELSFNDLSISAWVKMDATQLSYPTILSKGGTSNSNAGYWFYFSGSYLKLVIGDGTTRITAVSNAVHVQDDIWHHVAVTINRDSSARFFIDGVNVGTTDISSFKDKNIINLTRPLTVGSASTSSTTFFKGLIDDVRLYNTVLSDEIIDSLSNINNIEIIAYLALDENNGNIANDSTGHGNNGLLINGPTWKEGLFGNALQFDGRDDKVNCGSASQLDISTGDFSISTWVNLGPTQSNNSTIASKGGFSNTNAGYWLALNNGKLRFNISNGTNSYSFYSNHIYLTDNIWHHVAITIKRDGNLTFFMDGDSIGSLTTSNIYGLNITNSAESLLLGSADYRSTYLKGFIDEFRVYKYALSMPEILELAYVPQENTFKLDLNESFDQADTENIAAYPNPFTNTIIIRFLTIEEQNIQADIYDIRGTKVASLYQGILQSGENMLNWDGNDFSGNAVSEGIYFVSIINDKKAVNKTIIKMN